MRPRITIPIAIAMIRLILKLLLSVLLIASINQAEAKGPRRFKPERTFTLTVVRRLSFDSFTKPGPPVPIPSLLPDLAVGQKVRFTIGPKGRLTARKINLLYSSSDSTSSNYEQYRSGPGFEIGSYATVTKDTTKSSTSGKVDRLTLNYNIHKGFGSMKPHYIIYRFE